MARFIDEAKTAVRSAACAVLSANEFINGGIGAFQPASRGFFNDYINRTRRLIGCTPPDVVAPLPPFIGGQCQGVRYGATYEWDVNNSGNWQDQDITSFFPGAAPLFGPIGVIGDLRAGQGSTICGAGQFQGSYELTGANAQGQPIQVGLNLGGVGCRSSQSIQVRNLVFTPIGSSDQCGDPEPIYPPPIDIDVDIDITYEDDDGNPINITIPFTFAPITVNFDGSLRIPFSFDFGGFNFDGSLNLSPEIDVDINLPPLPRGTGQGTETQPPGDPENEVEPEEQVEKIIGVVVSSTINAQSGLTNIATQNMPNIVAPRLGSVKFAYSLGASTFWSNDIDIKGQRVFIPCPFSQGADAAVASPVPGVSLSFVEIRGFPLATAGDVARLG